MIEEKEILEGNKLIAKFDHRLNFKNDKKNFAEWIGSINGEIGNAFMSSQLKYHKSWDWIMFIVEQIENIKPFYSVSNNANLWYDDETDNVNKKKLQYVCIISNSNCRIIINSANYFPERNNKLISTWYAVVEFIKWYNQNKNNE